MPISFKLMPTYPTWITSFYKNWTKIMKNNTKYCGKWSFGVLQFIRIHPICSPPPAGRILAREREVRYSPEHQKNYCRGVAIFIPFRCWQGILFSLCWLLCNTPWIQCTSRRCRNYPGYSLAFCYLYDHRITMLKCLPRLFH